MDEVTTEVEKDSYDLEDPGSDDDTIQVTPLQLILLAVDIPDREEFLILHFDQSIHSQPSLL